MDPPPAGTRNRRVTGPGKERPMGIGDKAKNAAKEAKGKVKKETGKATDDRDLQAKGDTEQTVSALKQARQKAKDAFKK
jgi:uncharacterized protein YjbJ (UPF0337 family)